MKLKMLTDIQINTRKLTAGTEFEATKGQAELLLEYGWAEVVEEVKAPKEEKAPKAKASKKTTKKK